MKFAWPAMAICGALLHCPGGFAAESIPVVGSVQFWTRTCSVARCDFPEAMGSRIRVNGLLTPPSRIGAIGRYEVVLTEENLSLRLQFLWPSPPDGSSPYLVAQGNLTLSGMRGAQPISECSQYQDQSQPRFFPVGACGGFVQEELDGAYREYAVTFFRE